MRLDFNVLWVEDNAELVQSQKDRIATILRKEGFRLAVEFAPTVDRAAELLSSSIFGDHIDLVLMDYDLGAGRKGIDGVMEVRNRFAYKDIIFYSGQQTADLAAMIADERIGGVFTAYRPELPDIVQGVFENLVRKVLDIDHSRGIVMGATSDIDQMVNRNVSTLYDTHGDIQTVTLEAVKERIATKREELSNLFDKIERISHVGELETFHLAYTSDDRFRLLAKILKAAGLHQDHKGKFENYRSKIVPRRNELAHVRVVKEGFSRKLYDKNGIEMTADSMKELRADLLEFHDLLESLFPE